MKNLVFALLLLCCCTLSNAQGALSDFYKKGATWCEYERFNAGFGTFGFNDFQYWVGDDTLINSATWKLLWCHANLNAPNVIGALKVDAKKVYFFKTDTISTATWGNPAAAHISSLKNMPWYTDILLYDFELSINDSVTWKPGPNNKVIDIDSIQLSTGQWVKRFYFEKGADTEYWLEGPGSNRGLLGARYYYPLAYNAAYHLGNIVLLNPNPNNYGICFPTGIAQAPVLENLSAYPNPLTGDDLQLTTPKPLTSITVFDVMGRVSYRLSEALPAGSHRINILLPPGLYVMKCLFSDGTTKQLKLQKL